MTSSNIHPNYESIERGPVDRQRSHRYDNYAETTKNLLIWPIVQVCYGTIVLGIYFLTKDALYLHVAFAFYGISGVFLIAVLYRILRFYLFRRHLEASDLPVDPDESLSVSSYMRILAFQAPEDDSTDQESKDGTEPENDDFF
ncbi:hypothetical protein TNIN_19321 [Trichonephila inaurata madagascariensis]|uniref:Uncharacterized protein n=1 Tax=Trichonephila inaurata madagascariensis TaxID=2747483 RepID=A0A8X6XIJ7_9ARAC|nr:hypothetical protein TNIN_19321 [Trichonephila inaurata madagascariensis]